MGFFQGVFTWAVVTKYHSLDGSSVAHIYFSQSGGCKSRIQALANLLSAERGLLPVPDGHPLVVSSCPL